MNKVALQKELAIEHFIDEAFVIINYNILPRAQVGCL
jgi:hypothetical protein